MDINTARWLDAPTSWLELSRANLLHNLDGVRALVGGARIMAVLKANAYGAGAVDMARTLAGMAHVTQADSSRHTSAPRAGVNAFGVATVAEGVELRRNGITGMIVCLAYFTRPEVEALCDFELTPSIFDLAAGRLLSEHVRSRWPEPHKPVWVKVDTGLGRLGVPCSAAPGFLRELSALPGLKLRGLFSTLTENPDRDPIQVQRLLAVRRALPELAGVPLSLASSHSIVALPGSYLDIVRPGILLHGLEPSERDRMDMRLVERADLRPIATWKARVSYVKTVGCGEQIGYGRRPALADETRVATLTAGWADGYPAAMSAGGAALIRGQRCPVMAVSANSSIVDVTKLPEVAINDEVVLLGQQGKAKVTAWDMARIAQSSVYRLLAAIPSHVPRLWG